MRRFVGRLVCRGGYYQPPLLCPFVGAVESPTDKLISTGGETRAMQPTWAWAALAFQLAKSGRIKAPALTLALLSATTTSRASLSHKKRQRTLAPKRRRTLAPNRRRSLPSPQAMAHEASSTAAAHQPSSARDGNGGDGSAFLGLRQRWRICLPWPAAAPLVTKQRPPSWSQAVAR